MYVWRGQDTLDLCICTIIFSCIYYYKFTVDNIENSFTEFLSGLIGFYIMNATIVDDIEMKLMNVSNQ